MEVDVSSLAEASRQVALSRVEAMEPADVLEERRRLAQALLEYGQHLPGCEPGRGCRCGLDELLRLAREALG
jgi:hypothetical protein